jgi:hypothetical protein
VESSFDLAKYTPMFVKQLKAMKPFFLFLLLISQFSIFGQEIQVDPMKSGPFILLKDGTYISVKKPVIVCEDKCYYINRSIQECQVQELSNVEGFSRHSDVRWMLYSEFRRIGHSNVRGFFWGVATVPPYGMGIFILSDLTKRKRIQRMYQDLNFR